MKKLFLFFVFILFSINLYSQNLNGVINYWGNYNYNKFSSTENLQTVRQEGIKYLNQLRKNAGLWDLKENSFLDISAQNHAKYLKYNDTVTHFEIQGLPYFTGKTPADRVFYAGYPGGVVIENLSSGDNNVYQSIDNLFSAIYHRLGFLNFEIDEVGIGYESSPNSLYHTFYVYNMGNSQIADLCEKESFTGQGAYYYGICKDKTKKISKDSYDNVINSFYNKAPKYIYWPYNGYSDTPPAFYEEIPDPLPECSVSGYPVSIQFNPKKINTDSFKLIDFSLFENNEKLTNVKLLTSENDPNQELDDYEYALMPLERLKWGTTYTAKVTYSENGITKTITWNFQTKKLDYPYFDIKSDYEKITLKSDKYYYLYFEPSNCNDKIMSYSYQYNTASQPDITFYDGNTLLVKLSGNINQKVIINTDNSKTVELTIGESESTSIHNNSSDYCGYMSGALLYLPCVVAGGNAYSLIFQYINGLFFDLIGYKLINPINATQCGKYDFKSNSLYSPCIKIEPFSLWAKFKYTGVGLTFEVEDYGKNK